MHRNSSGGAVGAACLTLVCLAAASATFAAPGDRLTRNADLLRAPGATHPSAAVRANGAFVVVAVTASGIEAQRYFENGSPNGDVQLIAPAPAPGFSYSQPQVAIGNDGGFVVAWVKAPPSSAPNQSDAVVEARVWANGPRSDIITVSTPSTYPIPLVDISVARDPDNGRFAVAWTVPDPIVTQQTPYMRIFYGGGNPLGAPFALSASPGGVVRRSQAQIALSNDGIVAAWSQRPAARTMHALRAKFFTRDGASLGTAFTVAQYIEGKGNPGPFALSIGDDNDVVIAYPRVTSDGVFEWGTGMYARRYVLAASSPARGAEFQVSSQVTNLSVDVDVDAVGNIAFAWTEPDAIGSELTRLHTRLYRPGGIAATRDERFTFNNVGNVPVSNVNVGLYDAGEFRVTFQTEDFAIYGQSFAGPQDTRVSCARYIATIVGSAVGETLNGLASDDVINALGGSDRVNGNGGSDVICGGGGADMLFGNGGRDQLDGGPGDDVLDGGDGWDFCNGGTQTNADTAVQCEGVSNIP